MTQAGSLPARRASAARFLLPALKPRRATCKMRAPLQKRGWGVPIAAPVGSLGTMNADRGRPVGFRQGKCAFLSRLLVSCVVSLFLTCGGANTPKWPKWHTGMSFKCFGHYVCA